MSNRDFGPKTVKYVKTPGSGGDALLNTITGASDKIIEETIKETRTPQDGVFKTIGADITGILTAITGNTITDESGKIIDAIKEFKQSFEDHFAALLAATYGWSSTTADKGLNQYKTRLQHIDITKTPFGGIDTKLQSIIDILDKKPGGSGGLLGKKNKNETKNASPDTSSPASSPATQTAVKGDSISNIKELLDQVSKIEGVEKERIEKIQNLCDCLRKIIWLANDLSTYSITKIDKTKINVIKNFIDKDGLNSIVKKINSIDAVSDGAKNAVSAIKGIGDIISNMSRLSDSAVDALDVCDILNDVIGHSESNFNIGIKKFKFKVKTKSGSGIIGVIERFNKINIPQNYKETIEDTRDIIHNIGTITNGLRFKDILFGVFKLDVLMELVNSIPEITKRFNMIKTAEKTNERLSYLKLVFGGICSVNTVIDEKKINSLNKKLKTINNIIKTILKTTATYETLNVHIEKQQEIDNLKTIFSSILSINGTIKQDRLAQLQEKLKNVYDLVNLLPQIWQGVIKATPKTPVMFACIQSIIDVLNKLGEINTNKLNGLIVFSNSIADINKSLSIAGKSAPDIVTYMAAMVIEMHDIKTLIEAFSAIDGRKLSVKKAEKLASIFSAIADMNKALSKAHVTGIFADKALKKLVGENGKNGEIDNIQIVINKLSELDLSKFKDTKKLKRVISIITLLGAMNIVLALALIPSLLAPLTLKMMAIEVKMLQTVIAKLSEIDTSGIDKTKLMEIFIIVSFCSVILFFAGKIGFFVLRHFMAIIAFTATLSFFIMGVIGGINKATKGMDEAAEYIKGFGKLIAICAGVMILGAMFMMASPWLFIYSMGFAIALGVFLFTVLFAIKMGTKGLDLAKEQLSDFGTVIGVSCLTMLIGAAFMQNPDLVLKALGFGVALGVFIFIVVGLYNLASKGIKSSMKHAGKLSILLTVSCFLMMFGAAFMQAKADGNPPVDFSIFGFKPGNYLWFYALCFGVVLGGFIFVVTGAYNLASKGIRRSIVAAGTLLVLIAVTSIILLIGGGIMMIPGMKDSVEAFAATVTIFIAAMGTAIWLLGKMKLKNIAYGVLVINGIAECIAVLCGALMLISKVNLEWPHMLNVLGQMGAAVVLVGGAATGLGAIVNIPGVALLMAEGAVVINGVAECIIVMAYALQQVDKIKDTKSVSKIEEITKGFKSLMTSENGFKPFMSATLAWDMQLVRASICSMCECIDLIAIAMQNIANLTIVTFDKNGKEIGKRHLNTTDFDNAATNVGKIITALGGTIIKVYNGNTGDPTIDAVAKEMFSSGYILGDLLGADTVFSRVTKSCATLGQMITDIAEGVKNYADMRVNTYNKDGKVIGSRKLSDADFINAARNVEHIITTLGGAVMSVYYGEINIPGVGKKDAKEMFDWTLLGDNAFSRVVKSTSELGNLIATIAAGVKDYANMRVNTYDKDGKVIGSREFTKTDFDNAATNVETILTTLARALCTTYNKNEELLKDCDTTDPSSVISKMTLSLSGVGFLIKDAVAGIEAVENMTVQFDAKGAKVKSLQEKVKTIFTLLAGGVCSIAKNPEYKGMFDDPNWGVLEEQRTESKGTTSRNAQGYSSITTRNIKHVNINSPVGRVIQSLIGSEKLISVGIDAINKVLAFGEFTTEDKNRVESIVSTAITVLSCNIYSMADQYKDVFKSLGEYGDGSTKNLYTIVKNSIINSKDLIDVGLDAINKLKPYTDLCKGYSFDISTDGGGKMQVTQLSAIEQVARVAVGLLANTIVSLANDHDDVFNDPGWFSQAFGGETKGNSPVAKVIKTMKASKELVFDGIKAIDEISKLNVDPATIGTTVDNILGAIPNAVLRNTLLNKDKKTAKWWKGDQTKPLTNVHNIMLHMSNIIKNVGTTYTTLADNGLYDTTKVEAIKNNLPKIVTAIITSARTLNSNNIAGAETLQNVAASLKQYYSVISSVCDIYNITYTKLSNMVSDTAGGNVHLDVIGNNIITMLNYIIRSVNEFNSVSNIQEQLISFTGMVSLYNSCISTLIEALNRMPETSKNNDSLQNIIRSINDVIKETPDLTAFDKETKLVETYVKTVNSINTSKVDRLTGLANALTTMSTKLGSLEGLTDVLANKVAIVLSHLSDQLAASATVIKTAEKIQQNRHAKITDAMKQLKQMMNVPLNVSVVHRQENNETPGGGTLGDTPQNQTDHGTGNGYTDSYQTYTSQTTTTGGVTRKECTQIAAQQARQAIDTWSAQQKKGGRR